MTEIEKPKRYSKIVEIHEMLSKHDFKLRKTHDINNRFFKKKY